MFAKRFSRIIDLNKALNIWASGGISQRRVGGSSPPPPTQKYRKKSYSDISKRAFLIYWLERFFC